MTILFQTQMSLLHGKVVGNLVINNARARSYILRFVVGDMRRKKRSRSHWNI